jgi:hypothetical protein
MSSKQQEAERIISAIKNGVVPHAYLKLLGVGREYELKEFERCLKLTAEGSSIVKFLIGDFGCGKTFLLSQIEELALNGNFAVAKIQVGKDFKFNKTEEIYYNVTHSLRINGSVVAGTCFDEMFGNWVKELGKEKDRDEAVRKLDHVIVTIEKYNSSFAIAFKAYIKARLIKHTDECNSISAWIKGEKNIPAATKAKFGIKGDVDKENSLDFLKAFLKITTLLGYSGLVVLVDETSLITNERSDIRAKSYENIKSLIDMSTLGQSDNCMFVFGGTNELIDNAEKGIRSYPALYNRIINGYDLQSESLRDLRQPIIRLRNFKKEELKLLTIRTINIHKIAYYWNVKIEDEDIESFIERTCKKNGNEAVEPNTREYLKNLVDALDIMEQNPGVNLFSETEFSGGQDKQNDNCIVAEVGNSQKNIKKDFEYVEDEMVDLC